MCYTENIEKGKGGVVMPEIRPMRDLRKTTEISNLCHTVTEPVFITKNGYQDLVIMSQEEFERRCAKEEIYMKLLEAEQDIANGDVIQGDAVFSALRKQYDY
ncbi:MAG: type II toxin-antitoxin system Phd/YefM family antitoxin [Clostridia bacterium]